MENLIPHKRGLTSRKSLVKYQKEKERKKMRKPPKTETIKKKINAYAYKCGFTYHPQVDGTFALFDIHMGYYVCRGSHDRVVRFVVDELWGQYHRLTHS